MTKWRVIAAMFAVTGLALVILSDDEYAHGIGVWSFGFALLAIYVDRRSNPRRSRAADTPARGYARLATIVGVLGVGGVLAAVLGPVSNRGAMTGLAIFLVFVAVCLAVAAYSHREAARDS